MGSGHSNLKTVNKVAVNSTCEEANDGSHASKHDTTQINLCNDYKQKFQRLEIELATIESLQQDQEDHVAALNEQLVLTHKKLCEAVRTKDELEERNKTLEKDLQETILRNSAQETKLAKQIKRLKRQSKEDKNKYSVDLFELRSELQSAQEEIIELQNASRNTDATTDSKSALILALSSRISEQEELISKLTAASQCHCQSQTKIETDNSILSQTINCSKHKTRGDSSVSRDSGVTLPSSGKEHWQDDDSWDSDDVTSATNQTTPRPQDIRVISATKLKSNKQHKFST